MKAGPSEGGRSPDAEGRRTSARAGHKARPAKDPSVQSVYDFWLGLIPQFFAQMGAAPAGTASAAEANRALAFPVDQVARAAAMTQEALSAIAQAYTPFLQMAGAPGLLGQWNAASSLVPAMGAVGALMPAAPSAHTLPQAFRELGMQWLDATPRALGASFDRTFGALSDALGFGPVRKLQEAWKDLVAASFAQNEARGNYLLLVQRAFATGLERLLHRLAEMADNGERVESVLALMRMWAVQTEEAVHEVLQSEEGLVATANVTRAGLAYRRKIQHVALILADSLDMATRSDLDEAFREIQELKREVRALRAAARPAKRPARVPQLSAKKEAVQ